MKCDDCAHYSNNGKGDEDCDLQDSWIVKKENCPDFEDRYNRYKQIYLRELIDKAVEICINNDPDYAQGDTPDERIKDYYYRSGNIDALNALCHHFGINLVKTIQEYYKQYYRSEVEAPYENS